MTTTTELDSVTSSSETEYLEWHLRNYEDMPPEVILKMDLLRVGHWFTDAALELASDALVKSYRLFSYDLMSMKDMIPGFFRCSPIVADCHQTTINRGLPVLDSLFALLYVPTSFRVRLWEQ